MKYLVPLAIATLAVFFTSCQTTHRHRMSLPLDKAAERGLRHVRVIEVPSAGSQAYINEAYYDSISCENAEIIINRETQRAQLVVDDKTLVDTPIATGVSAHPTPGGSFRILSKKSMHASNLYGSYVDAEGNVVKGDVDVRRDAAPPGTTFRGTKMPFWHRLTGDGVGMHVGYVPPHAASHGCIRFPRQVMPLIFEKTQTGTTVVIQ